MGNQALPNNLDTQIQPKACCSKPSLFITNSNIDPCDITCSICFEIYRSPRIMKCRHTLCTKCISQWGKKPTATCPYCRTVLKRNRGNFGRADKITEKKIDGIVLKCRGCSWKGCAKKYFDDFDVSPSLDDDVMPQERLHQEQIQKQAPKQIINSEKLKKGTSVMTEDMATSMSIPEEREKEPPKELNYLIAPNQLSMNNPFGESLFLREYPDSPISRYFNMDYMTNWRERGWDEGFVLEGNDNI